jgi:hypothetical protein
MMHVPMLLNIKNPFDQYAKTCVVPSSKNTCSSVSMYGAVCSYEFPLRVHSHAATVTVVVHLTKEKQRRCQSAEIGVFLEELK